MLFFRLPVPIQAQIRDLDRELLSTSEYAHLYESVIKQYNSNNLIDINQLREKVIWPKSENLIDLLLMKGELEFSSFTGQELEKEMKTVLEQLTVEWLKTKRKKIQTEIEMAEKTGDNLKLKILFEELQKLSKN